MFTHGDIENRVRERAYWIWVERMRKGKDGDALQDWLEAESELKLFAKEEPGK